MLMILMIFFWLMFRDKFEEKTQKLIFLKTEEHKESNSREKYHFSINAFYKINLWPIRHFPLFEIFAHLYVQPALSIPFGREIPKIYDQKSKNEDLMKNTPHRCNS